MDALADLQRDFIAAVLGDGRGASARGVRAGRIPASVRVEAYRRNVAENLRAALAAVYPVVERLVGAAFFAEAAARYARAFPSASGDLHRFGGEFPAFLAGYPYARGIACLADVARLEWAWHECFHAADGEPIDLAALAAVPPGRYGEIRFRLHPAVRRVGSDHPILAIWEANQPEGDGTPARTSGPERVLVHREDFAVRLRAVDPPEWDLLAGFARGDALEAAAGEAMARGGEAFLRKALRRLAAEGVIAGFTLAPACA